MNLYLLLYLSRLYINFMGTIKISVKSVDGKNITIVIKKCDTFKTFVELIQKEIPNV